MKSQAENPIDMCSVVSRDNNNPLNDTSVSKPLDCEIDLGELLLVDPNAIEDYKLK